jgi:hypothetical protein
MSPNCVPLGSSGRQCKTYHQGLSHDSLGETGEVLDFGCGSELATGGGAIGHETLIQDG